MSHLPALVADIGGTHARLALASDGGIDTASVLHTRNADWPGFRALVGDYLAGREISAACIAAAGPVTAEGVRLTNGVWHLKPTDIPTDKTHFLNDLQGMAHALGALSGAPGARLVLNIGTGLNAAVRHPAGATALVPPAEAGYARLPLLTTPENAILHKLAKEFGAPVMEAALSGPSLPRLHRALTGQERNAAQITAYWPDATRALYLAVLGAYLGDLALAHLPYGGIWLAGSLGRAVFPLLTCAEFRETFRARGPYEKIMDSFAFHLLDDELAALSGAALYLEQGQAARD
ncbi:glucokinase [Rhodobacteraceae bacterium 63075]|nr:glucokinase [Rhodobacteraceae bacterium 63075]